MNLHEKVKNKLVHVDLKQGVSLNAFNHLSLIVYEPSLILDLPIIFFYGVPRGNGYGITLSGNSGYGSLTMYEGRI